MSLMYFETLPFFLLKLQLFLLPSFINNLYRIQIGYIIFYKIFIMLTKVERYQKLIETATKTLQLFHKSDNQGKKTNVILQINVILPSKYPFKSSQQIDNNISIIKQITYQKSKQYTQSAPILLKYEWPQSCIGLILCEHHQNNQTFYVYGTGTLIKNNIVLTRAQNVYCRRLKKQYVNIRFITGVNGNKCNGIYDVMQVHYPKEYTMQQDYGNQNFAVLQLYDDLSDICGYVGWKTYIKPPVRKLISYAFMIDNKDGLIKLQQIRKNNQLQSNQGFSVLMKAKESDYYIVGINNLLLNKQYNVLSEKMRNIVNSWIGVTTIDLGYKNIGVQECMQLRKENWKYLNTINLQNNNIKEQGCKYLSQANWTNLITIDLSLNKIGAQGCKYLSQTNWKHLSNVNLDSNNINTQGCKYLVQANWINLATINLCSNNINIQGCKYLSHGYWRNLTRINLHNNNTKAQGCKYLSQANWINLTRINLNYNNIDRQGCKHLCQANWIHLKQLTLYYNNAINGIDKILLEQLWINAIY